MRKEGRTKCLARSPTLDTVRMIEEAIASESGGGNTNRTAIWRKLPKKVMWQTYVAVLDYLERRGVIKRECDKEISYLTRIERIEKKEEIKEGTFEMIQNLPSYIG